jgi:hypothetical protein
VTQIFSEVCSVVHYKPFAHSEGVKHWVVNVVKVSCPENKVAFERMCYSVLCTTWKIFGALTLLNDSVQRFEHFWVALDDYQRW